MEYTPTTSPEDKKENVKFINEVNFIQTHGEEPGDIDRAFMDPSRIAENLILELDRIAHGAAIIRLLLEKENVLDEELNAVLQRFSVDGEYGNSLASMQHALLQAHNRIEEIVGREKVRSLLPEAEKLQAQIHEEYIQTTYGDY